MMIKGDLQFAIFASLILQPVQSEINKTCLFYGIIELLNRLELHIESAELIGLSQLQVIGDLTMVNVKNYLL